MKKAERIFWDTRRECRNHIKSWGLEHNPDGTVVAFNSVIIRDDETYCTRTLNAVAELLRQHRNHNYRAQRLGIIDMDELLRREQIAAMIEQTIENSRKAIARHNP